MKLNIYIKKGKYSGVFTNDRELILFLKNHPSFRIWYFVLKNGKLDGVAFLTKFFSYTREVRGIVQKWKKQRSRFRVKNARFITND